MSSGSTKSHQPEVLLLPAKLKQSFKDKGIMRLYTLAKPGIYPAHIPVECQVLTEQMWSVVSGSEAHCLIIHFLFVNIPFVFNQPQHSLLIFEQVCRRYGFTGENDPKLLFNIDKVKSVVQFSFADTDYTVSSPSFQPFILCVKLLVEILLKYTSDQDPFTSRLADAAVQLLCDELDLNVDQLRRAPATKRQDVIDSFFNSFDLDYFAVEANKCASQNKLMVSLPSISVELPRMFQGMVDELLAKPKTSNVLNPFSGIVMTQSIEWTASKFKIIEKSDDSLKPVVELEKDLSTLNQVLRPKNVVFSSVGDRCVLKLRSDLESKLQQSKTLLATVDRKSQQIPVSGKEFSEWFLEQMNVVTDIFTLFTLHLYYNIGDIYLGSTSDDKIMKSLFTDIQLLYAKMAALNAVIDENCQIVFENKGMSLKLKVGSVEVRSSGSNGVESTLRLIVEFCLALQRKRDETFSKELAMILLDTILQWFGSDARAFLDMHSTQRARFYLDTFSKTALKRLLECKSKDKQPSVIRMPSVYVQLNVARITDAEVEKLVPKPITKPFNPRSKEAVSVNSKPESVFKMPSAPSKPSVSTSKPIVSTGKPSVLTSKPIVSTGKPSVSTSKPIVSTSKPIVSTGKPTVSTGKPSVSSSTIAPRSTKVGPNVVAAVPRKTPEVVELSAKSSASDEGNRIIAYLPVELFRAMTQKGALSRVLETDEGHKLNGVVNVLSTRFAAELFQSINSTDALLAGTQFLFVALPKLCSSNPNPLKVFEQLKLFFVKLWPAKVNMQSPGHLLRPLLKYETTSDVKFHTKTSDQLTTRRNYAFYCFQMGQVKCYAAGSGGNALVAIQLLIQFFAYVERTGDSFSSLLGSVALKGICDRLGVSDAAIRIFFAAYSQSPNCVIGDIIDFFDAMELRRKQTNVVNFELLSVFVNLRENENGRTSNVLPFVSTISVNEDQLVKLPISITFNMSTLFAVKNGALCCLKNTENNDVVEGLDICSEMFTRSFEKSLPVNYLVKLCTRFFYLNLAKIFGDRASALSIFPELIKLCQNLQKDKLDAKQRSKGHQRIEFPTFRIVNNSSASAPAGSSSYYRLEVSGVSCVVDIKQSENVIRSLKSFEIAVKLLLQYFVTIKYQFHRSDPFSATLATNALSCLETILRLPTNFESSIISIISRGNHIDEMFEFLKKFDFVQNYPKIEIPKIYLVMRQVTGSKIDSVDMDIDSDDVTRSTTIKPSSLLAASVVAPPPVVSSYQPKGHMLAGIMPMLIKITPTQPKEWNGVLEVLELPPKILDAMSVKSNKTKVSPTDLKNAKLHLESIYCEEFARRLLLTSTPANCIHISLYCLFVQLPELLMPDRFTDNTGQSPFQIFLKFRTLYQELCYKLWLKFDRKTLQQFEFSSSTHDCCFTAPGLSVSAKGRPFSATIQILVELSVEVLTSKGTNEFSKRLATHMIEIIFDWLGLDLDVYKKLDLQPRKEALRDFLDKFNLTLFIKAKLSNLQKLIMPSVAVSMPVEWPTSEYNTVINTDVLTQLNSSCNVANFNVLQMIHSFRSDSIVLHSQTNRSDGLASGYKKLLATTIIFLYNRLHSFLTDPSSWSVQFQELKQFYCQDLKPKWSWRPKTDRELLDFELSFLNKRPQQIQNQSFMVSEYTATLKVGDLVISMIGMDLTVGARLLGEFFVESILRENDVFAVGVAKLGLRTLLEHLDGPEVDHILKVPKTERQTILGELGIRLFLKLNSQKTDNLKPVDVPDVRVCLKMPTSKPIEKRSHTTTTTQKDRQSTGNYSNNQNGSAKKPRQVVPVTAYRHEKQPDHHSTLNLGMSKPMYHQSSSSSTSYGGYDYNNQTTGQPGDHLPPGLLPVDSRTGARTHGSFPAGVPPPTSTSMVPPPVVTSGGGGGGGYHQLDDGGMTTAANLIRVLQQVVQQPTVQHQQNATGSMQPLRVPPPQQVGSYSMMGPPPNHQAMFLPSQATFQQPPPQMHQQQQSHGYFNPGPFVPHYRPPFH